ncbi:hypothetical protein C5E11_08160 [Clavibacter michiganensis]|nr:hypothetical protein [Clavibacter michiganensis]PPF63036.1 hypothetical protein C5E11_08160 [Clavibacter michiganensis]
MTKRAAGNALRWASVAVVCLLGGVAVVGFAMAGDEISRATPPTPHISQAQLVADFANCMGAKGWPMEVDLEEGSASTTMMIMGDVEDSFAADSDACSAEGDQFAYGDYTRDERMGIYKTVLESRDCLIDLGYEMRQPPGFEAYDASGAYWTPFEDVPHRELHTAEKSCPQPYF